VRVLVAGAKGMLGRDLVEIFSPSYEVTGWDLPDLDITRAEETRGKIAGLRPRLSSIARPTPTWTGANPERTWPGR